MYKGILYLLAATFTFSLVNLGVKVLSPSDHTFTGLQDYPVHELVFVRSLISFSICFTVVKMKGIPVFGVNKKWLLIRGLSGSTGLFLFFLTLQHLPMAVATTIQYLSPMFTVLFAISVLNEKVKSVQWLFFCISLSGIFVLGYNPKDINGLHYVWILLGILSALFSGFAYSAIMKCKDTDHPVTVVMYFPIVAIPITLVMCLTMEFVVPVGIEWLILLAIGILTQIAQVCMTRAFIADSASTVAPLKYLGSIYAALMGFFIFDERLTFISGIGIILIIVGVLLNTWFKKFRKVRVLS